MINSILSLISVILGSIVVYFVVSPYEVHNVEWEKAETVCEVNNGVKTVTHKGTVVTKTDNESDLAYKFDVKCENGAYFQSVTVEKEDRKK